jgi:hypothetical protein
VNKNKQKNFVNFVCDLIIKSFLLLFFKKEVLLFLALPFVQSRSQPMIAAPSLMQLQAIML